MIWTYTGYIRIEETEKHIADILGSLDISHAIAHHDGFPSSWHEMNMLKVQLDVHCGLRISFLFRF
jgi:hypothetical protein